MKPCHGNNLKGSKLSSIPAKTLNFEKHSILRILTKPYSNKTKLPQNAFMENKNYTFVFVASKARHDSINVV